MKQTKNVMVVACYPESARTALNILKQGGNAVDAFIAATLVDYVVSPGVTTLAGQLTFLFYNSQTKGIEYLNAGFNVPTDYKKYNNDNSILIPGSMSGLITASKNYGHLEFSELCKPAISLARYGFLLPICYTQLLKRYENILKSTKYGQNTFFRKGILLKEGQLLVQEELANTLTAISQQAEKYIYNGAWGNKFIQTVNSLGEIITNNDLINYRTIVTKPIASSYRGIKIFVPAPPSYAGVQLILALNMLEYIDTTKLIHPTLSADTLYIMHKITKIVDNKIQGVIEVATSNINKILLKKNSKRIVQQLNFDNNFYCKHSNNTIVVDHEKNIITGINTSSSMPWGNGIFVDGVVLNTAGYNGMKADPKINNRLWDPLTLWIMLKSEVPFLVGNAIGSSLFPADFQIISNIVDFNMSVEEAILKPRFGKYKFDLDTDQIIAVDVIDKRYSLDILKIMEERGVFFEQDDKCIDLGLPALVMLDIDNKGSILGMIDKTITLATVDGW